MHLMRLGALDRIRPVVAARATAGRERGGQWVKGRSAETFDPAGPWLVTPDEIDDVLALDMWLDVSGVRRLEPGDLINTGTPPGVGLGLIPPVRLQPGDVVEPGIDGPGRQRQRVVGPR